MLSVLVLCAASLLVVLAEELCASAGFAGVVACAIMCGVVALLLSDCGVVLVLGVALLSGVVVVVVLECCVVVVLVALASGVLEALPLVLEALPVLPYASVAGLAHGWSAWALPLVLLGAALSWVLEGVAGVEGEAVVVVVDCLVVVVAD